MKWYINQRIVALENHCQGAFKEGDEFIIRGLRDGICKCGKILIDIGKKSERTHFGCLPCHKLEESKGIWWFIETSFAPLEEGTETTELSEVLVSPNGDILEPQTA